MSDFEKNINGEEVEELEDVEKLVVLDEEVVEDVVVTVVGVSLHAASSIESTSKRDIKEIRFFIRGSFCIALLS